MEDRHIVSSQETIDSTDTHALTLYTQNSKIPSDEEQNLQLDEEKAEVTKTYSA